MNGKTGANTCNSGRFYRVLILLLSPVYFAFRTWTCWGKQLKKLIKRKKKICTPYPPCPHSNAFTKVLHLEVSLHVTSVHRWVYHPGRWGPRNPWAIPGKGSSPLPDAERKTLLNADWIQRPGRGLPGTYAVKGKCVILHRRMSLCYGALTN